MEPKEFQIDNKNKMVYNAKTDTWDIYGNGNLVPKSISKLYKFYSLNLNSIAAFYGNYFYLSNPSSFNDPFDCSVNLIKGIPNDNNIKRNHYKNIGVCCLTEIIDNTVMWGHYTNNYNGFALEFKGDDIGVKIREGQIERHALTKVIYSENPPQIERNLSFAQHYVLTTKLESWSYEREWRLIAELSLNKQAKLELEAIDRMLMYDLESVTAIYIGHNVIDNNKPAYILLLEILEKKYPSLPIYVVHPHPTELKLKFEKLNLE